MTSWSQINGDPEPRSLSEKSALGSQVPIASSPKCRLLVSHRNLQKAHRAKTKQIGIQTLARHLPCIFLGLFTP